VTDDIVTRLRKRCDSTNCWCPMGDEQCLNMEAADEIERLRAEYEHCRLQMLVYQRIAELGPQAVRNG